MNALMNITIRVSSAAAQARIKALEAQLAKMRSSSFAASGSFGRIGAAGSQFMKLGNQIQWAGRQLQYNFTLPILLAGGAATKFALDNEKAMTRVVKVYGDGSKVFNRLAKTEIPALSDAFRALSDEFGVNQAQVIQIAGDWAAAGASGIALAKSVKLTLETMILGELDAAKATESLIAIQAQYGQDTEGLAKTIAILNMVENQTGASMAGLIDGLSRSAGVARSAGIDVEHLAAMMAALTPAAGSAANAGNALKTIISRLLAPTKEANEVMGLMGINTKELSWQSQNGAQRIETMAKSFKGLDDAQKAVVSSVVASRWQINKFDVLMRDITNTNGYYRKSLNSTSDSMAIFRQKQKELNVVLSSNPQKLKQMWTILQNAMADVIQPLIPYIVYLAMEVAKLANAFSDLDPSIQKAALAFLVFLAAIGPIGRYVGSVMVLVGTLTKTWHWFALKMIWVGKVISFFTLGPLKLLGKGVWGALSIASTFAKAFPKLIWAGVVGARKAWTTMWFTLGLMRGWWSTMRTLWAINFALIRGLAVYFWTQTAAIWTAGAALQAGIWQRLWAVMLLIQKVGQMALVMLGGRMLLIVEAFAKAGRAIIVVWKTTWVILRGMQIAASATMLTISAAFAAGEIGIFGKLGRMLVLVWGTATKALLLVWRAGMETMALMSIQGFKQLLLGVARAVFSIPGLIVAAVLVALGVLYHFRDEIKKIWDSVVAYIAGSKGPVASALQGIGRLFTDLVNWIMQGFNKLPAGVQQAMINVINVLVAAVKVIINLLSYLNPFAHHSPSLVENVTKGMDVVGKQFARIQKVGPMFSRVTADLKRFKQIAGSLGQAPWHDERVDVAKAYKSALPLFDRLVSDWKQMNALLARQKAAVDAQQAVVDKWAASLEKANAALDRQQARLDRAQDKLDKLNDAYSAHQQALENFANAPIKGMKKMEDAIFANDMAQKKLQLDMMKWEDANGTLDDLSSRLQNISGDIEMLRGKEAELRAAGAGSDITGPIQQQIDAMEAESKGLQDTIQNSPIADMQAQLAALQRQAEEMDLEKALKFDPLTKQIQDMVDTTKELTFQQIIDGIKHEQGAMDRLQPKIDSQTAAVARAQAAVDKATAARDRIQKAYDRESKKLDHLNDQYGKTQQAIQDIESALNSMGSAAGDAVSKLDKAAKKGKKGADAMSPGAENFLAAKGGNFPDVGGKAKIGREFGMGDQSKMIDQFTQGITDDLAKSFGSLDMFAPVKEKWNAAWSWVKTNVGPKVSAIGTSIKDGMAKIGNPFGGGKSNSFTKGMQSIWDTVSDIVDTGVGWVMDALDLFAPDAKRIWKAIVNAGKKIWTELGPEIEKFGKIWKDLGPAFKHIWAVAKPLLALFGVLLLGAIKILASVISHTLGPVLDFVIDIIKNLLKILRGIIEFVVGVFSGDWKMAWQGIQDIFSGLFYGIIDIIKDVGKILWGIVKGIVVGVVEWFKWLWDKLIGHSIVWDIIDGIKAAFKVLENLGKWVWDHILKPVFEMFKKVWTVVKGALKLWWAGIKAIWAGLTTAAKWVWDHVLEPIFQKVKDLWSKHVKPNLAGWWDAIKKVWNALTTAAAWVWNNVLQPIFQKIKDLWTLHVKPELKLWWERIKSAWDFLTGLGTWFKTNVMDKVFGAVKSGWQNIKDWLHNNKDMLLGPMRGIANGVLKAVNTIIKGLNKISDVLPGPINWHIDELELFARGGMMKRHANRGFKTNGARAIVGEGKANYPEFVIPTDPTHRSRAKGLMLQAMAKMGYKNGAALHGALGDTPKDMMNVAAGHPGQIPKFGIGGWLSSTVSGATNWFEGKAKNLLNKAVNPILNAAENTIKKVGWDAIEIPPLYGIDKMRSWLTDSNDQYNAANTTAQDRLAGGPAVRKALKFARSQVGDPYVWGGVGPNGFDCSGFQSAITNVLRGKSPYSRVGTTAGFPWAGFTNGWSPQAKGYTIGSTKSYAGGVGHMAGTLGGINVESRGGEGVIVGSRARGYYDPGFDTHAYLKLAARGAMVKGTRHGTALIAGENYNNEAIVPLKGRMLNERDGKVTKNYNFYGDLSFPNITDPADAEAFIKNLEILAETA